MNYRLYDQNKGRLVTKTPVSTEDKYTGHVDIQRIPSPCSNDQIKKFIVDAESLDPRSELVFYTIHGMMEPDGDSIIKRWTPGISIDIMITAPRNTRHSTAGPQKPPKLPVDSDRARAKSSPTLPRNKRFSEASPPPMPSLPPSGSNSRPIPMTSMSPKPEIQTVNPPVAPAIPAQPGGTGQHKPDNAQKPKKEKGGCCIIC